MNQNPQPHSPNPPTVDVRWPAAGVAQVVLGGEHDLDSAARLQALLGETLETCAHLIVDLSSTDFIDSATIRALLATKGRADATNRQFNLLVGTRPIVERVLELTGVLTVLNRAHTLEDILASTPKPPTR